MTKTINVGITVDGKQVSALLVRRELSAGELRSREGEAVLAEVSQLLAGTTGLIYVRKISKYIYGVLSSKSNKLKKIFGQLLINRHLYKIKLMMVE